MVRILLPLLKREGLSLDAVDTLSTFMINDQPEPVRFLKVADDLVRAATKTAKGEHPHIPVCGEFHGEQDIHIFKQICAEHSAVYSR